MLQILILSGVGILAMISEIFNFRKWMLTITLVGLAVIVGLVSMHWGVDKSWYSDMLVDDRFGKSINN